MKTHSVIRAAGLWLVMIAGVLGQTAPNTPPPAARPVEAATPLVITLARTPASYSPQKAPPLFAAILRKDPAALRTALDQGADVNAPGPQGLTPLITAIVFAPDQPAVEALLEAGATVDAPDQNGYAPLYYSIWYDRSEITAGLLRKNADPSRVTPRGDPALRIAIFYWRKAQIELLLGQGVDPFVEAPWGRMIHYAAERSDRTLIGYLVQKGEDIDRRALGDGATPLIRAAKGGGGTSAVRAVLEFKPNVDVQDNAGWTALMHAAWLDKRAIFDVLVDAGANPKIAAPSGETAYLLAARRGAPDLLEKLAALGAPAVPVLLPVDGEKAREPSAARRFALALASAELYWNYYPPADLHSATPTGAAAAQLLRNSFHLADANQLRAKLDFYLNTGERANFAQRNGGLARMSEGEFAARLDAAIDDPVKIVALKNARRIAQAVGPQGLLGWDICHHNFLAALGARARWLPDEEAWNRMDDAARRLRGHYRSWGELAPSLLAGWQQGANEPERLAAIVKLFLNRDDPHNPWALEPLPAATE